jgi:hypothetical protein
MWSQSHVIMDIHHTAFSINPNSNPCSNLVVLICSMFPFMFLHPILITRSISIVCTRMSWTLSIIFYIDVNLPCDPNRYLPPPMQEIES